MAPPRGLPSGKATKQTDVYKRQRVERALISLGKEELRRLAAEEPMAKVSCQFCNREYCVDVPALLRGLGI